MTQTGLNHFYKEKADEQTAIIRRLKLRNRMFVFAELLTFVAAIAMLVSFTVWGGNHWLCAALLLLVAYVVVRRLDTLNGDRIDAARHRHAVYSSELKYLSGDFSSFDAGERYVDTHHPYAVDMDIFGRQSLFHRINRTVTSGGSDYLAACLARQAGYSGGDTIAFITARREAIRRLAALEPQRTAFISSAAGERLDTEDVKAAVTAARSTLMPAWMTSAASRMVALLLILVFLVQIALSLSTSLPGDVPLMWGTLQFVCVFMLCSSPLRRVHKAVDRLHRQLKAYSTLVRLMTATETRDLADSALGDMSDAATGRAMQAFTSLDDLLNRLDRRGNWLGLFLFDTFALSDFFLVRRFAGWQQNHAGEVERWIDRVSVYDALVSMATFRYNEPAAVDADVVDADAVVYEAEDIRHPFLGVRAVGNDFTIADRHFYIVTGANMAGKSTFLRSLGVNYVLAVCGMPVFARRLRVSVFNLFSSMRTNDDLDRGISYFNAELRRLSQLLDSCRTEGRTLIILDEILRGTNSLDKLNGSRMFLEAVSGMNVTGVIATHDLELSRMADERPDRFHNHCFEIKLADTITYTYKISPGVARNQNATHLLKNILSGELR